MYPVPKPISVLVGLICAGVLATAVAGAIASIVVPVRSAWALFGFEIVTMVAGALGLAFAGGRFREGPGMALACIGGTILAAAGLGFISVRPPVLGTVALAPFLAGRVGGALLIGVCAAACVLSRDRRAWPTLIKGIVLGLPVVAAAGVASVPAARGLVGSLLGTSPAALIVAGVAAFAVFGALFCASVHLVIRAFELGRTEEAGPRRGSST